MRVKIRPGTHFADVKGGVFFRHGTTSFTMVGPPALYQLLDASLEALADGAGAEELARSVDAAQAEPVFDRLLTTLLERDVAFDLDALTPMPEPEIAVRHEEALRWCEDRCADPYAAFANIRAASVAIVGSGPAVEPLRRGLESFGVGTVTLVEPARAGECGEECGEARADECGEAPGEVTCAPSCIVEISDTQAASVDGCDRKVPYPAGVLSVQVIIDESGAVVGAPVGDAKSQAWVRALARRALLRVDAQPAAYPLSAVLAGSLAAHQVLQMLAEPAAMAATQATVVHGRLLETSIVLAPPAITAPAQPAHAQPAHAQPAFTPSGSHPARTRPDPLPVAQALEIAEPVLDPIRGLLRRGDDADVAQLPFAVATVEVVGGGSATVAGWGHDRESATLDAVLAAMRELVRFENPADSGAPCGAATAGAAMTWPRATLDARLRTVAPRLVAETAGRPVTWAELTSSRAQSLWSLLEDFYELGVRVETHALQGESWVLATVRTTGAAKIETAQWAPSMQAAVHTVLAAAVAIAQSDRHTARLLAGSSVGAHAIVRASSAQVFDGLRATERYAAGLARRFAERRHVVDDVIGELPIACGWSWLA